MSFYVQLTDFEAENIRLKAIIEKLEKENKALKHKIYGLESTVTNYKEKDEKRFRK